MRAYPAGVVVSFGRLGGLRPANPEVTDVDLSIGRELAGLGLLIGLLTSVMWLLAKTRRSPRLSVRSARLDPSRVAVARLG